MFAVGSGFDVDSRIQSVPSGKIEVAVQQSHIMRPCGSQIHTKHCFAIFHHGKTQGVCRAISDQIQSRIEQHNLTIRSNACHRSGIFEQHGAQIIVFQFIRRIGAHQSVRAHHVIRMHKENFRLEFLVREGAPLCNHGEASSSAFHRLSQHAVIRQIQASFCVH